MQLLVKFKTILPMGSRDTLNFRKFKVAPNLVQFFCKSLQKIASYHADYNSIIKNVCHPSYRSLKIKLKVF